MKIKTNKFNIDDTLFIKGQNLMKESTYLFVNDEKHKLDSNSETKFVSSQLIKYKFSASDTAGQKEVRIVHQILLGTPKTPHFGFTSKSVMIKLLPKIINVSFSGQLTLEVLPKIIRGQKCILKLMPEDDINKIIKMDFSQYVAFTNDGFIFTIPVANLLIGGKKYLIQINIDGAENEISDEFSFTFP